MEVGRTGIEREPAHSARPDQQRGIGWHVRRSVRRTRRPLVALVVLVAALAIGYVVRAANDSPKSAIPTVALSALPPQAAHTVRLIRAGGPFPFPRDDGIAYTNSAHRLPRKPAGSYHQYVVPTPGKSGRGTRRIVTGPNDAFYWSPDNLKSFQRIELDQ